MNARRGFASRLAWLGLAALLMVACAKDKKTLLLVNVSAQGAPTPTSVAIEVIPTSGLSAGAVEFAWSKSKSGPQQFGVYLPDSVVGPATVLATGKADNGIVQSRGSNSATIVADKTNGPVDLTLQPLAGVGDAGVEDTGVVNPDQDASVAGQDTGGADLPMGDAPEVDAGLGDANGDAPVDGTADLGSDGSVAFSWEPAENVEKDSLSRSSNPSVAVEPTTENVFVAWYESNKVKVMRYDRQLATWGAAKTLESQGIPSQVAVGTDAFGNIMVAWIQSDSADPTLGVWTSQSSDGVQWTAPQQVATGKIYTMSFAMARNGIARMAWSKETGTNKKGVFTAAYDKTSWTVDTAPVLDPNDPAVFDPYDPKPQLVIGGTGDGIVTFAVRDEKKLESVGAVNLTGSTRSALHILDTDTGHGVLTDNRSAAMNANGDGVVVWPQLTSPALNFATYNPAVGWSSAQRMVDGDDFYTTAAALDASGNITVAWVQALSTSGNNLMAIHGKVGGSWSEPMALESDNTAGDVTADYAVPMLAADGLGNVQVVWRKKTNAGTFGAYARRLQDSVWQPQVKLGQKADLKAFQPRVAAADSGFAAATFVYVSPTGNTTDPDAYNVEVALFR